MKLHGTEKLWLHRHHYEHNRNQYQGNNIQAKSSSAEINKDAESSEVKEFQRTGHARHHATNKLHINNVQSRKYKENTSKWCLHVQFTGRRVPRIFTVTIITLYIISIFTTCSSAKVLEEQVDNNKNPDNGGEKGNTVKNYLKNKYENVSFMTEDDVFVAKQEGRAAEHPPPRYSSLVQRQRNHQGHSYYYEKSTTSKNKGNSASGGGSIRSSVNAGVGGNGGSVGSSDSSNGASSLPFPIYYAAYIANAVESGVREANNLYETVEPALYKKDLVIKGDHPAFYLAAINRQSPKAKELAKYGYATLKATTVLKEQLGQFRDERDHPISEISLSGPRFQSLQRSMCPTKRQVEESCPPWSIRYRKVDGSCNNLRQTHMGSSFQPFARYLPPEYDDGVSTIRKSVSGKPLPSARRISTTIHKDVSSPSSTFTLMVMHVVYGSTDSDLQALRMFTKGHLRYSNMSGRKSLLPRLVHPPEDDCVVSSPRLFCFAAGDGRVNEQPGLTTLHTVWMRQHNLVADRLAQINPHWEEERLFQETRKIIVAQLQFITFREFLPLVLGPDVIKVFGLRLLKTGYYAGYNDTIDGTIPSVFAAAAFRFGHSLVQPTINRCDESHHEMPYKVDLSQEMMSPMNMHNFGEVDRISLGLVSQKSQRRDEFITNQLTNHLFKTRFHPGLDLAAINIQRGRDHGLPPYLKWRDACGLNNKALPNNKSSIVDWEDFSIATEIPPEKVQLFSQIYQDPWDVDLFPGAMIEYPVKGGLLGPTFSCIIAQTFRNLRRGDRFWFENPGEFTEQQLKTLRNITLARVMCDTSDAIKTVQPIVFLVPQERKNAYENCTVGKRIPIVDYKDWKEEPFSEAALNSLREGALYGGALGSNQPSEEPSFYNLIEEEAANNAGVVESSSSSETSTDYFANLPPYLQKKFQTLFS